MTITLEITERARRIAVVGGIVILVAAGLGLNPYSASADEIPIPTCGPGEEAQPSETGYECGPADLPCPEFEDYYLANGVCPGDEPLPAPAPPSRQPVAHPVAGPPVVRTTTSPTVEREPAAQTPEAHPVASGPTLKTGLASVVTWKIGI